MRAWIRSRLALFLLSAAVLCAGCAEPPQKELHQAQGAIDAARAAGAEQYAADELEAATVALSRAHEAVQQRDYRLALNHALDSRERAQNAARDAADGKALARSRAERLLAEVTSSLAATTARLTQAEAARVPKTALEAPYATVAAAQKAVQEAGAALAKEDYRGAAAALEPHVPRLNDAIRSINEATVPRPTRPPRRRR